MPVNIDLNIQPNFDTIPERFPNDGEACKKGFAEMITFNGGDPELIFPQDDPDGPDPMDNDANVAYAKKYLNGCEFDELKIGGAVITIGGMLFTKTGDDEYKSSWPQQITLPGSKINLLKGNWYAFLCAEKAGIV